MLLLCENKLLWSDKLWKNMRCASNCILASIIYQYTRLYANIYAIHKLA